MHASKHVRSFGGDKATAESVSVDTYTSTTVYGCNRVVPVIPARDAGK